MLDKLKEIATNLNIEYSRNIGQDKLVERIKEYCVRMDISVTSVLPDELLVPVTPKATGSFSLKDFTKPQDEREYEKNVRCIVTCSNPNRSSEKGAVITVANSKQVIRKYIPFNIIWHVPKAIVEVLENKFYSKFVDKRINAMASTSKQIQAKEYHIEYLDPITDEEREAIKKRQLLDQGD